jgi:hypothetical protein
MKLNFKIHIDSKNFHSNLEIRTKITFIYEIPNPKSVEINKKLNYASYKM